MMLFPVRTVAPAADLVSLAEIKAHCRIDHADEDDLLTALGEMATAHLDGYAGVLGRCLVNQTWRVDFTDWSWRLRLPFPNVASATVAYFDESDVEQSVDASLVELVEDAAGSFVRFRDAFTKPGLYDDRLDPVRVTIVAGYGATAADVPAAIRRAAMIMIGDAYENRETVAPGGLAEIPMSTTVYNLIAPYRRAIV